MSEEINHHRRRFLGTAAMTIAAVQLRIIQTLTEDQSLAQKAPAAAKLPIEGKMASLGGATEWLNSQPLAAARLRGNIVLIDFWTYTCINWLRTLPYVRAWAAQYKDQGLVVIGVHTPEFSFEQDIDNVRRFVKETGIEYPVAIDNDRAIWHGFGNHYWPALYFLDAAGHVRDHHFGE